MSDNKDENNRIILEAEIANLALSVDEDTVKNYPKMIPKIMKRIFDITEKLNKIETVDPHKDDPRIKYDMEEYGEKRLELEEQLASLMADPHRQTNKWYLKFWPVLVEYTKLMNSSLFRNF